MSLEIVFVSAYGLELVLWAIALKQLRAFLSQTPAIVSAADLSSYEDVVRRQMYLALGGMVLLAVGLVAGIALVIRGGARGFLIVLAANAVVLGSGLYLKRLEKAAQTLPVEGDELAARYRRATEVWRKKPLPDF